MSKKYVSVRNMSHEVKGKIQLFQIVRRNFAMLGISSNCLNQPNRLDTNLSLASLSYSFSVIAHVIFLLQETKNFREFTDNVYETSSVITVFICFVIVVFKMRKLFEFIESCQNIIDKRETYF